MVTIKLLGDRFQSCYSNDVQNVHPSTTEANVSDEFLGSEHPLLRREPHLTKPVFEGDYGKYQNAEWDKYDAKGASGEGWLNSK